MKNSSFYKVKSGRERTALLDEKDNKYSYADLEAKAQKLLGVIPPRSLVVLLCHRDIETVSFYYCMLLNHVIPIMLGPEISDVALEKVLAVYQPEYVWTSAERKIQGQIVYRENGHNVINTGHASPKMHEELALLLSTSGSTGSGKLVRISYDNLRENIEMNVSWGGFNKNDVGITTLPINYCYGLSVLHYHWSVGAPVVVSERSMMDEMYWKLLKQFKITSLQLAPYNFTLMRRLDWRLDDFCLRTVFFAGSKMRTQDRREAFDLLRQSDIDCCIAYGQTETVSEICGIRNEEILQKENSIGRTFDGIKAQLDPENQELILSGNSICMGYALSRSDLALGDVNKGVIRTGDRATMDGDGYIYLEGRLSRFIKLLGIRYSLDEIEELLQKEFSVEDMVCTGNDDALKVFIAGDVEEEAVIGFCTRKLGIYKRMVEVHFVDEIPRNESGKILYGAL